MSYPGPVPNSLTSESDQRAEYDANLAAQREHVAEAPANPVRIFTRPEMIDELRRLANRSFAKETRDLCRQAADELARYDAECFAGRLKG